MEDRGRVTGGGGGGAGVVLGGVCAAAGPKGEAASATDFRNPRRPVGLLIWCECSIVRGVEVVGFGGFAFLSGQCRKGRKGEGRGQKSEDRSQKTEWPGGLVLWWVPVLLFEAGNGLVNANWTAETNYA